MTFRNLTRLEIDTAATGELVAGVADKVIRVYGLILTSAGGTSNLNDGDAANLKLHAGAGPVHLPLSSEPYLELGAGLGLDLTLSATDQNNGALWYSQE